MEGYGFVIMNENRVMRIGLCLPVSTKQSEQRTKGFEIPLDVEGVR